MTGSSEKPPRWDLCSIFAGFDSPEYIEAKKRLAGLSEESIAHLSPASAALVGEAATVGAATVGGEDLADWLDRALKLEDEAGSLYETLASYAYASYSTATKDARAMAELNAVEELALPLKRAEVLFKNALASRSAEILSLAKTDPRVKPFAFHLEELLRWQAKQMSPDLEDLAEDLSRSGGDAWGRLQEAVSSNASVLWDEKSGERKTVVELRNLAYDADRDVRAKAYELELRAWKSVEIPVAAALNGVKGFALALNKRRGWTAEAGGGALDKSIEQARMTRATLDSLIGAIEDSLPVWRRYLKAKATLLGLPACAF